MNSEDLLMVRQWFPYEKEKTTLLLSVSMEKNLIYIYIYIYLHFDRHILKSLWPISWKHQLFLCSLAKKKKKKLLVWYSFVPRYKRVTKKKRTLRRLDTLPLCSAHWFYPLLIGNYLLPIYHRIENITIEFPLSLI